MNATFTDPSDSSAWFYQRWLLGSHEFSPALSQALLTDNNVTLLINQSVSADGISLHINNENESTQWRSWQKLKFSKLWFGKFDKSLKEVKEVKVNVEGKCYPLYCSNQKWIYKKKKSKSCSNKNQLLEQLSNYKQLADMEPDNKWALLTPVHLMRKIDFMTFKDDILASLNILLNTDPLRSNYYKDLRKYT